MLLATCTLYCTRHTHKHMLWKKFYSNLMTVLSFYCLTIVSYYIFNVKVSSSNICFANIFYFIDYLYYILQSTNILNFDKSSLQNQIPL